MIPPLPTATANQPPSGRRRMGAMEDERWHPWLDAMKAGNPHECGEVNRTRHGNDWRCTLPKGHLGRCERTAEFASWSVRAARIERLEQARDAARKGVA